MRYSRLVGFTAAALAVAICGWGIHRHLEEDRKAEIARLEEARKSAPLFYPDLRGLCSFIDASDDRVWIAFDYYEQEKHTVPYHGVRSDGTRPWYDTCDDAFRAPAINEAGVEVLNGYDLWIREINYGALVGALPNLPRRSDGLLESSWREIQNLDGDLYRSILGQGSTPSYRLFVHDGVVIWTPDQRHVVSILRQGALPATVSFGGTVLPAEVGAKIYADEASQRAFLVNLGYYAGKVRSGPSGFLGWFFEYL